MILAEAPWAFGWTAIAGLATAVLAGVTWWLAKSTRDLVRETDQDIRSQWRPIVVVDGDKSIDVTVVKKRDSDEQLIRIELELWNRGRGPALNCVVKTQDEASTYGCQYGKPRVAILSVDGSHEITLAGSVTKAEALSSIAPLSETLVLIYEDVAENVYETTTVLLGGDPLYDKHLDAYKTSLGVQSTELRIGRQKAPASR
jgi:hypothetical protein